MEVEFIDGVHSEHGVVTVTIRKRRPDQRVFVVMNPPEDEHLLDVRDSIESAGFMAPVEGGYIVSTKYGDLFVEEVLQRHWPSGDAIWTKGIVEAVKDLDLTIAGPEGTFTAKVSGNGYQTISWHRDRLEKLISVGDEIHYKLSVEGPIAAIRHPEPRITEFGIDALAWHGMSAEQLARSVAPEAPLFMHEEVNAEQVGDGWEATSRTTLDDPRIIEFVIRDGELNPAFGNDHSCIIGADGITIWGRTLSETLRTGAIGERLAQVVDLPFPHGNPLVRDIQCYDDAGTPPSMNIEVDSPLRALSPTI